MAPTADLLPEPKKWRPVHAVLEWTVLEDETLQVSGFGGVLRCAAYAAEDAKVKRGGAQGVAAALGALVGGGAKSEERRVSPSAALAGSHINGSDVKTSRTTCCTCPPKALPDFNGKMVTARLGAVAPVPHRPLPPHPADRPLPRRPHPGEGARVAAAAILVDFVFFYQRGVAPVRAARAADTIPVTERAVRRDAGDGCCCTSSACSLRAGAIEALTDVLELALEIDTGRHVRASSPIVLYVIRLLARVDGYVRLLLEPPADVRGISNDSDRRSLTGAPPLAGGLGAMWAKIQTALTSRAAPMLLAWCGRAVAERQLLVACGLHAHVALIHAHLKEEELDEEAVGAAAQRPGLHQHKPSARRRARPGEPPPAPRPCAPPLRSRSHTLITSLITRMSEPPTAKWYGRRPAARRPAPI